MALQHLPRGLILDYGGVVVSTAKRPTGFADLTAEAHATLRRAGVEIDRGRLEQSIRAGFAALKDYNNVCSRRRRPNELTHAEIWADFMASDLPERAQVVLAADAQRLCRAKIERMSVHTLRPGIRELLALARRRGVRVGIASNAQSGAAHRAFIEAAGLTDLFDVQLYSDEIGIRKPHPGMLTMVAEALNVPIDRCWYVGDTRDRDLVAGRRAGVDAVVLIRHHHTDSPVYPVEGEPDALFDEVTGLVDALAAAQPAPVPALAEPAPARVPRGREIVAPRGLLVDNGGVLSLSVKAPQNVHGFAADLGAFLRRAGHNTPSDDELVTMLEAGHRRYRDRKEAHDEVTPAEFWGDLMAADWPSGMRAAVVAEATTWTRAYVSCRAERSPRPGMLEFLACAKAHAIPVAIVSNTICGKVSRANLTRWGFAPYLAAQFYSDEFGFRKPDPRIVRAAAEAIGVDPAWCWFVGDKRGRDVLAARRARVATTVIIRSRVTSDSRGPEPELVVDDADGLLAALRRALRPQARSRRSRPAPRR